LEEVGIPHELVITNETLVRRVGVDTGKKYTRKGLNQINLLQVTANERICRQDLENPSYR
jgi:hypothetical protein